MLSWVAPEPEPEPEPKAELSKAAKDAINSIFKLYDKDKSGALSLNELKKALEKTGIDPDEIKTCARSRAPGRAAACGCVRLRARAASYPRSRPRG